MAQIATGKKCNTVMLLNGTYFIGVQEFRIQEEERRKKKEGLTSFLVSDKECSLEALPLVNYMRQSL
jgi:hypothetical protein